MQKIPVTWLARKDFYASGRLMDLGCMTPSETEESTKLMLDFKKLKAIAMGAEDVLPAVIQDAESKEVLLIAYVNAEALRLSLAEKRAVFYSTSRGQIWRKGDTSGDTLALREIRVNCEQNSLLYLVTKTCGACHTKDASGKTRQSCYYRRILSGSDLDFTG